MVGKLCIFNASHSLFISLPRIPVRENCAEKKNKFQIQLIYSRNNSNSQKNCTYQPHSSSYTNIPRAHKSTALSCPMLRITSGAILHGVPQNDHVLSVYPKCLENPKSTNFTYPSRSMTILSDFKSLKNEMKWVHPDVENKWGWIKFFNQLSFWTVILNSKIKYHIPINDLLRVKIT